ncbi:MAG: hypothetical protein E3J87_01360 [Candidatus Cloacimonadota bacterium]|nr:MAG: hypothetical protein E3J87_01360 [Candidatus Cloacimonadota bacterium]
MIKISTEIKSTLKEVFFTVFTLLKIIIPISIIVKILKELGLIDIIGRFLAPVMKIVGLPGESGLIWATAMVTNVYGGLIVFFSMAMKSSYTIAQVTVLCTMILIAHTMPIELRIAQRAGVRLWFMLALRVFSAFILGWLLHFIYSSFHLYQIKVSILWNPGHDNPSILYWILGELKGYGVIFLVILVIISLMRIFKKLGVINRLNKLLEPLLRFLGMSKDAAPLTIIGMTLGVSYGGGLIIKEAKSGALSKKDIFLALSLMGLSHSLIEDTLLMVAMGASLTGVLLGRILFTIIVMFLLIKCIKRISEYKFNKFFVRGKSHV